MLHVFTKVSAFVVFVAPLAGCSLLLDWADYSDGLPDSAAGQVGEAPETGEPRDTGGPGETGSESGSNETSTTPPEAGPDVADDSPPPCASACHGCCSATGDCQGGESANSCGAGGQACLDCQSSGMACVSGSCAAADTADVAAPPLCEVSMCSMTLCIPAWQAPCCKSDNTCGCRVLYPPGSCM
ncbi:MAG: hypothetical protein ACLP1X_33035 [Polyangiaceae bacterium]